MKSRKSWKVEYLGEIKRGLLARSNGNEGMARVCARRAAGIVIGEYLQRKGYTNLSDSAYARLTLFTSLHDEDPEYKEIASHCLMKVNQDRQLTLKIDLINEVILLKNSLLLDTD